MARCKSTYHLTFDNGATVRCDEPKGHESAHFNSFAMRSWFDEPAPAPLLYVCADCGASSRERCPYGETTCSLCSAARDNVAGHPDCPAHGAFIPPFDNY